MFTRAAKLLAAYAIVAAGPGLPAASPDPARPAMETSDSVIGDDVTGLARQWLAGDPKGRSGLEHLADAGRADAQEALGELLGPFASPSVRDDETACDWFAKAATSRADALHNLALCYETGRGRAVDLARAADLYRQAADRGYPRSSCALGNLYVSGRGVPQDEAKGVTLCRKGAELGEANAQTDLGNFHLQGIGVPKDVVRARRWYELAAAQGQRNAQFVLGQIYWNGDGVERDQAKAVELWKAAYRGGRTDAAPLLAKWLASEYMSAHPRGDTSLIDEALRYQQVAVDIASGAEREKEKAMLAMMEAAREAAANEK